MVGVNNITIIGNLTGDPELRYTPNGTAVANFRIAVNRRWQDNAGEWCEDVSYIPVTVWKKLAENCSESLKKGDRVVVNGRLQMRTWETKEGQTRNVLEIIAKVVASSLEWATTEITKNPKQEEYTDEVEESDDLPF